MKTSCNVILGAGGAKAVGQVGALKALEEAGWRIENICGVSAGAVLAVLYAYDYQLKNIYDYALEENFYNYRSLNKSGLLKGIYKLDKLGSNIISRLDTNKRICNLHIVTCSIISGEPVFFKNPSKEDLPLLLEASCAIPVLFRPVEYGKDYLVDGGVWQTIPMLYFENTEYKKIPTFVVSCSSQPGKFNRKILASPLKLITRSFAIIQSSYVEYMQKTSAYYSNIHFINPSNDLGIDMFDFNPSLNTRQKAIDYYYMTTKEVLGRINK